MSMGEWKITTSDHGVSGRDGRTRPAHRPHDIAVREFLAAGARKGLTIDQMFPVRSAGVTDVPDSGA